MSICKTEKTSFVLNFSANYTFENKTFWRYSPVSNTFTNIQPVWLKTSKVESPDGSNHSLIVVSMKSGAVESVYVKGTYQPGESAIADGSRRNRF